MQRIFLGDNTSTVTNANRLNCTANDIRISGVARDAQGNARVSPSSCNEGVPFTLTATFEVVVTANSRYDAGFFFRIDGGDTARGDGNTASGLCSLSWLDPGISPALNLDTDFCGDLNSGTYGVTFSIPNVQCVAAPNTNPPLLKLPNCTSWHSNQGTFCDPPPPPEDKFYFKPDTKSKCVCDDTFTVPVHVETATISVTKDASPASLPEPGGEFTYTVGVTNTSDFTTVILDRICDDQFGTVVKVAAAPDCTTGNIGSINSTDCVVPQTLTAPFAGTPPQYSCTFKASVTGEPKTVTDKVTVYGHTDPSNKPVQGDHTAQVSISDVPPTAQVIKSLDSLQCAIVRYGVKVQNRDTAESLTLTALSDNTFGNIANYQGGTPPLGENVVSSTCSVPQTLTKDDGNDNSGTDQYTCTFDAKFCASSHTDKVTGTLNDNNNNTLNKDSNELTVNVSAE
jgi:hypothetical protein